MTATELNVMVQSMRTKYHDVKTRADVTEPIYYLWKGIKAIGRHELADELLAMYSEIDSIDTQEIVKLNIFS